MSFEHLPVLLHETIGYLDPRPGGVFLDCTVGGGGHASEICRRIGPGGTFIGLDRDPAALVAAGERLSGFSGRLELIHADYVELGRVLRDLGIGRLDGVLFDFGVSSHQLDTPERGFSYQHEAPLDMRMDPTAGATAAELLATISQKELARLIREYGEERWASRIAAAIVRRRAKEPIRTTTELAEVVKEAIPAAARREGPHPARRTFQALRIAVNEELEGIRPAIEEAVSFLRPGGVICAISFHSLEDRLVKETLRDLASDCVCPPGSPACTCDKRSEVEILTRKPVVPSEDEQSVNPRSRSAKLRAARSK